MARPPAELRESKPRIGDEFRRIAGAPRHLAPQYRPAADPLDRSDHFAHRIAVTGPEIERDAGAAGGEPAECARTCASPMSLTWM